MGERRNYIMSVVINEVVVEEKNVAAPSNVGIGLM